MNHDIIKSVIFDQHEIIKNVNIVQRDYTFEEKGRYVLTGLRRAGKSTLLYDMVCKLTASGVAWERIIYINFEDERLAEFTAADFNDILSVQSELSSEKGFFFFDEIQNIEGWEKFARRMADAKEHVCITGSNAKMLGREIATTLGGRYFSREIGTYDFREYLKANKVEYNEHALLTTKTNGIIRKMFREYFFYGGFPEALEYTSKREYVSGIYQKILLGDIIARNRIRNPEALRILIKKIAESVCSEISFSRLHSILKSIGINTGKDTLIEYASVIKDAYLIFSVENYFSKFAEKMGNPKYYFKDNGLLNLFLTRKETALLENIFALYLYRKYGEDGFFFMKSAKTGVDVDFYVPEKKAAFQVAYSLSDTSKDREISNLVKLYKNFDEIKELFIVTYEEESVIEKDGVLINVVPAYKMLL